MAHGRWSLQGRIGRALEAADIKMWELFRVDNCSCKDPPLGIPQKDAAANAVAGGFAAL